MPNTPDLTNRIAALEAQVQVLSDCLSNTAWQQANDAAGHPYDTSSKLLSDQRVEIVLGNDGFGEFVLREGKLHVNFPHVVIRDAPLAEDRLIRDKSRNINDQSNRESAELQIEEFWRTCVIAALGASVSAQELYEAYTDWSAANGLRSRPQTGFGRAIKDRARKVTRNGRVFYDGIKLCEDQATATADAITALEARLATVEERQADKDASKRIDIEKIRRDLSALLGQLSSDADAKLT